jgi:hypothetical protein
MDEEEEKNISSSSIRNGSYHPHHHHRICSHSRCQSVSLHKKTTTSCQQTPSHLTNQIVHVIDPTRMHNGCSNIINEMSTTASSPFLLHIFVSVCRQQPLHHHESARARHLLEYDELSKWPATQYPLRAHKLVPQRKRHKHMLAIREHRAVSYPI